MENMWLYEFDGAKGIVIAESEDEAKRKVNEAYRKHASGYCSFIEVYVKPVMGSGSWFSDSPDVVEVC